jgi:putative Ca2+/H+ antiporter (TMEM165/GDT1 family)
VVDVMGDQYRWLWLFSFVFMALAILSMLGVKRGEAVQAPQQ